MYLKDGKQLEKLLVGEVKHPVEESLLIRNGITNLFSKKERVLNEEELENYAKMISRLPDGDKNKSSIFSEAIRPIRKKIMSDVNGAYESVRNDQINEDESLLPSRIFASRLLDNLEDALENVLYAPGEDGEQLYELRLYTAVNSELDDAKNVDFWVELRDVNTQQPVAQANIDIKTNPNSNIPNGFADTIYYFNTKYNDDKFEGGIRPDTFEDMKYKGLVKEINDILRDRLN